MLRMMMSSVITDSTHVMARASGGSNASSLMLCMMTMAVRVITDSTHVTARASGGSNSHGQLGLGAGAARGTWAPAAVHGLQVARMGRL
jgi:hypothetical protein